ncbi:BTB/POZ domain-containing protein NPY2 [Dendrobium catenatum]|uniref:BTB/POZ domain-containing protein NPY2 n=1 Tax=Dendrobium catenatum TaxID=906689 RepID=A0A2I0WHB2_9ASPA|nr:BTB/POZ domain-containing protein NPY2 [Dendrobium catenatum]
MKYMKLGTKPDAFQSDGENIRFAATELETDIIVNVGDVKFYLHKFPLLSKSLRLQRLIATIDEERSYEIAIPDIPGGSAAFEVCAKFCYGMIFTLNAYNVVSARCAAEHLEMLETVEKGNMIHKIDVFLNSSILRSWKDSIITLQTTKILQPWTEELKIVHCCIESIASKASIDPAEVKWSYTNNRKKLPFSDVMKKQSVPQDWWVEDLCELEIEFYKQVIIAIKSKGLASSKVVGESLKAYAYIRLPGFSNSHGGDLTKHQTLLETIVWLFPPDSDSVSCSFLLKLLKVESFLDCGENCKKELIKRIGYQLQDASVADLLIPAPKTSKELQKSTSSASETSRSKVAVANLVDGYLAEVAKDPNLPLSKFIKLAEMASGSSRLSHNQLYHAIDMFLKEHPGLKKFEKKKICSLLDCNKLSHDTCIHAAQNDHLPLRIVVQILYFEQLRQFAIGSCGTNLPSGRAQSLVHQENRSVSYASSRSAASSNTEDELNGVSIKPVKLEASGENGDDKSSEKVKGGLMPKRIISNLWSGKVQVGESSSSGTPESIVSMNPNEARSTPSRHSRQSVS